MIRFRSMLAMFAALILWAGNAYAYLDPATGSMLIQGIVAAIAGVALVLRTYWHKFKGFFARILGRSSESQAASD